MPLWVKVFIGIGAAVLLLIVGVAAFGGTEHGPGRHFGGQHGSSTSSTQTPTTEHSGTHAPPESQPAPAPEPSRAT